MTLETHFNEVMHALLGSYPHTTITAKQLIHTIDLTLLDEHASTGSLTQLKQNANLNHVAALCIYLQHLKQFSSQNTIPLATVINFPQGNDELDFSLASIEKAMEFGVAEIDYVLPYHLYLQGQKQEAINQCQAVSKLCKQHNLVLKIILETGAFPDMQTIYTVSKELIDSGCDFLKTSTGKIAFGASLPAVFAILSAIRDTRPDCGIKVSGGIKKPQDACNYAMLSELIIGKQINKSWFRIGASSLLDELLKII
ncbi:2-deoxyribose-5-phosphate aldolase [Legionella steigerwaltii]|uniref:deoxyribose-phosphate aldolase n=1 Tax=Legionella steigerwaltii TaxID=460 RepID=A0A378LAN4_9GAMM|nr:deoxyribose-phosphate aldolase [Legionella steigerwaltii]KTD77618.1 2-deoxyribose-5-phosphate aldolase [Legionella steigerwaltii]STY22928.1 2-deoxyribose-5-phosphate aldolase [Legionella steigerwaltii]